MDQLDKNVMTELLKEFVYCVGLLAEAQQKLADIAEAQYNLQQQRYDKDFPAKKEPTDATISKVKDGQDEIRERQGSTGEASTEEWIGLREQEFGKCS